MSFQITQRSSLLKVRGGAHLQMVRVGKKIPEDPGEPEWNPEVNSLLSKADGREKRKDTDHSRKKWKWGFPGCRRE